MRSQDERTAIIYAWIRRLIKDIQLALLTSDAPKYLSEHSSIILQYGSANGDHTCRIHQFLKLKKYTHDSLCGGCPLNWGEGGDNGCLMWAVPGHTGWWSTVTHRKQSVIDMRNEHPSVLLNALILTVALLVSLQEEEK